MEESGDKVEGKDALRGRGIIWEEDFSHVAIALAVPT
ncbi:hypothetical protein THAOC_22775, partial [Thalassiosira oceanica]